MNSNNKNNWMIWAIVILAVMNLSMVATIVINKYRYTDDNQAITAGDIYSEAENAKYSGRYFRDRLNLGRGQMGRFNDYNNNFRQEARDISVELYSLRREMLTEMSRNDYDTVRLNILSDSIGMLHGTLKRCTYRYYLDLKEVCNEEQSELLENLFDEMFTDDSAMGFRGRGWRGGQQ